MPTIHSVLRKNALNVQVLATPTSLTTHEAWAPVNNIKVWEDFTWDNLSKRFSKELQTSMEDWDYARIFKAAQTNIVVNENTLEMALTGPVVLVSAATARVKPGWFAGKGGRIHCRSANPDWAIANASNLAPGSNYLCQAGCVGDTKLGWDSVNAMAAMRRYMKKGQFYDRDPAVRKVAQPYEQAQHYCETCKTCYAWLWSEKGVTVVRATLSKSRSSPPRVRQQERRRHMRGFSEESAMSGISESLSNMSFVPDSANDIDCLEVAFISYEKASDLTPELAVFLLGQLAIQGNELREEYPPLHLQVTSSHGSRRSNVPEPNQTHQVFIPNDKIAFEVIKAEITRYIPGASVSAENHRKDNEEGYLITVPGSWEPANATNMLAELILKTASWIRYQKKMRVKVSYEDYRKSELQQNA